MEAPGLFWEVRGHQVHWWDRWPAVQLSKAEFIPHSLDKVTKCFFR